MAESDTFALVVGSAHALGLVLCWALALLVYFSRPRALANRLLGLLLYFEGLFQGVLMVLYVIDRDAHPHLEALFALALPASLAASCLYLVFLSSLDSPLTRPFRRSGVRRGLLALSVVVTLVASERFFEGIHGRVPSEDWAMAFVFMIVAAMMLFSSVWGLIACASAWRRAVPGTPKRAQAAAFLLAFGGRDAMLTLHLLGGPILGWLFIPENEGWQMILVQALLGLASVMFATFLAYGFLRTQLFDIDLRIKMGIRRGTVVGIILAGFFAAAKMTESYLNREVGFVAGSIIAGLLMFLVPKLNKVGEKVANVAMPQAQPTNAYLSFKKMEVYRAAVESAHETGGITEKERAALDKLRQKLGLTTADTEAVEAELTPTPAQPAAGSIPI